MGVSFSLMDSETKQTEGDVATSSVMAIPLRAAQRKEGLRDGSVKLQWDLASEKREVGSTTKV